MPGAGRYRQLTLQAHKDNYVEERRRISASSRQKDIFASGVWPLLSNLEDPELLLDKIARLVASVTLG